MWEFEDKRLQQMPMHEDQHGFRTGQSTETALTTFLAPIEQAAGRDQFSLVALLDAESAFNMIIYPSLLNALEARGAEEAMAKAEAMLSLLWPGCISLDVPNYICFHPQIRN